MKQDYIFFGESGLTSTSANYISNLAKESYKSLEQELNEVVFYTTKVGLLGFSDSQLIKEGTDDVSMIASTLETIAQTKSLIAWLREAIKAKERLIKEAQESAWVDYGIDPIREPIKEKTITEDDVLASWNIKKRNRYYYLGSLCATIGEYIHPSGHYAVERESLQKILHSPCEVKGNGRDTIIYTKTPTIKLQEVEDVFMSLQAEYRGYQAELNSLKHEIQDTINKDDVEKTAAYKKALGQFKLEYSVADAEYQSKKKEAILAASNLKIIIPDSLKSIYETINSLGK